MKKTKKNLIVGFLIIAFVLSPVSFSSIFVSSQTTSTQNITGYQEWNQSLTVDSNIVVEAGATLVINKGVFVSFSQASTDVEVYGTLVVKGTSDAPVTFSASAPGSFSIRTYPDSNTLINSAVMDGGGYEFFLVKGGMANKTLAAGPFNAALDISGGNVSVSGTVFKNSTTVAVSVLDSSAVVHVNNSSFLNNSADAYSDFGSDFKYNWWGAATGPAKICYNTSPGVNYCYYPKASGNVDFSDWLTAEDLTVGASNVLFLPGIKASRLYKKGILGTEDQLWLPNYFGNDLNNLKLDENGQSIENVYTRDVLDEVPNGNLYKSFLEDLASLKSSGTINDFKPFAYDWRQSAEDVAIGTPYEGMTKSVVEEVKTLAGNSKSHKVTIVAHSNGGLVAKATMLRLAELGLAHKVDKIIFVGTPQMGTPLSILSMLYGYDEAILTGALISRSDARSLSENMPGVYGLLPSEKYLAGAEPFIDFSGQSKLTAFKDAYGENINSFTELRNFLLGSGDGRTKPAPNDVEAENILNQNLLDQAIAMHQRLDAWAPPLNVQVVQLAGWGLDTVSGIAYSEKENVRCDIIPGSKVPSCTGMGTYTSVYDPKFTVDGDAVVVAPSALMLADGVNVEKYWVDIHDANDTSIMNREHRDLLEITSVKDFIKASLNNVDLSEALPQYIFTTRPNDYSGAEPRLRMSLHSPLNIHLYDDAGNHTGVVKKVDERGVEYDSFEENIPNSYYYQMGERKYVGFPSGENIRIEMDGYALGEYTLKAQEVNVLPEGEELGAQVVFADLVTTDGAKMELSVPVTGLADISTLKADLDNDGVVEYEATAQGAVSQKDEIAPEAKISFNPDTQKLEIVGVDDVSQNASVVLTEIPVDNKEDSSRDDNDREKEYNNDEDDRREEEKTIVTAILTDEAGNTTKLVLEKEKDKNGRLSVEFKSITYNDIETQISRTSLQYKWRLDRSEKYKLFASNLRSKMTTLESHYIPKKNQTWLMEKPRELKDDERDDDSENRLVKTKLPGLVIPGMLTEQGGVKVIY